MKKLHFAIIMFLVFSISSLYAQDECKVLIKAISDSYEGGCKKGLAHGEGVAKGTDRYEGRFKKGLPHGYGVYTWKSGDVYKGNFKKGEKKGLGKFVSADKKIVKEGIFKADTFNREKEMPKYYITFKQNVTNVSISASVKNTDQVIINLKRDGKYSLNVNNLKIDATSGRKEETTNNIVFDAVSFPFECTISFKAPGRLNKTTQTGKYSTSTAGVYTDCKVTYKIVEEGSWEVTISY